MTDEELKKKLMKIDKEVLVNFNVRLMEFSVFEFTEQLLDDLKGISKTYSDTRKLNRLLKQIETGDFGKNRRKKGAGRRTKKIR